MYATEEYGAARAGETGPQDVSKGMKEKRRKKMEARFIG